MQPGGLCWDLLRPALCSNRIYGGWALGAHGSGKYIGSMFRQLIKGISSNLPSQCTICHAWPARALCSECVAQFAQPMPRCRTCALPVLAGITQCGKCIAEPPPLDRALAAVAYGYPWSLLVQDLKFHQNTARARNMATLMRSTPWVEPAIDTADWLIPMPLHPARLRERGFNQSQLLAQSLDRSKTRNNALLRIQPSAPQTTLPRKDRIRNMQGAFALEPSQYANVQGKSIVIVDDVMTTGASLHAAANTLRAAGAARITGLVFARTE